jgi:hypothetical protein
MWQLWTYVRSIPEQSQWNCEHLFHGESMFKHVKKCMHGTVIWIHNLTTRWRWMVSFTPELMCLWGKRPPPPSICKTASWMDPQCSSVCCTGNKYSTSWQFDVFTFILHSINILGVIFDMQKCTTKVLIQVSYYYCSILTQIMRWQILEKSSIWNLKKIHSEVLKLLCTDGKRKIGLTAAVLLIWPK